MAGAAATTQTDLVAEEARLARAAAAGDGSAFAELYQRYASRAYNLALRISDSEEDAADAVQDAFVKVMRRLPALDDRELAFGSYLFTATRNATYDLLSARRRDRPSDSIPESAITIGAGAGGLGLDPGDPEDDPDRKQLLASQQEEIRAANGRLPERQREALALRELEDLSYDEIAELMEMNRNSVAQLISRARIRLRDELRGSALASITASSPDCERALPLIAMRDDGQLDPAGEDAAWLIAHLRACERCQVATEAMQEAGVSYRAWAPIAVAPWIFKATMARAAELTGADWSEQIAGSARRRPRWRALAAGLSTLLIGAVAFAVLADGDDGSVPASSPVRVEDPVADDGPEPKRGPAARRVDRQEKAPQTRERKDASAIPTAAEEASVPPSSPGPSAADESPPQATDDRAAPELDPAQPTPEKSPKPAQDESRPESTTPPPAEAPTVEEPPATTPPPTEEPPAEEPPAEEEREEQPPPPPPRKPPVLVTPGGNVR